MAGIILQIGVACVLAAPDVPLLKYIVFVPIFDTVKKQPLGMVAVSTSPKDINIASDAFLQCSFSVMGRDCGRHIFVPRSPRT
jgi:hypothetical protein